ncbi:hypothetical protein EKO23_19130 [Nocardioides guangzhouensis]|uniref:Xaa-Pro dipeptidyl-peptidase-like domain-containing protein n=1 Tax=Nocardioides guangzhouensis TaxID=2497878 RepID=A0A4Q4Z6Q5_9ACTN|nr:CocE/NonD family hydrolase [Nocardioides guangzhouensis]RYP83412.1 hypothetical protein EKO23_19130 [Nocardioides guangzhouensis]
MDVGRATFVGAVAVLAVHVVDDSFVQPEPGTSAADHWVAGLATLGLLGLAVWGYGVVRPGARAVIALLLGLFALVVSGEAWQAARSDAGASGDDWTGLLVLPAGIVLIGLAAVLLWRSRRTDDRRLRRYVRRAGITVAAVLLLGYVVLPFLLTYGYTHVGTGEVAGDLGDHEHTEVTLTTSDGIDLNGTYVPSRNGAAVIAFPGRGPGHDAARFLADAGYGVLLYDRRGASGNEGDPNALGWGGVPDVEAGVAFLRDRPEVDPDRIGGIGFSVGGELLLETAAGNEDLRAVVSEGAGIRSTREAVALPGMEKWLELPVWTSTTLGTALFSGHLPPEGLQDLVPSIAPRPLLLIYAARGQGGERLTEEYFAAAGQPKQLWKTDSSHTAGYDSDPDGYARRVLAFFDDALLAGPSQ